MPIFYEVAILDSSASAHPFALMRIDTDKRIEGGCEAVVVSLHKTKADARSAADLAKATSRGAS